MTDYFALLDEPRRPWLDTESLKQKFLSRSATVHPDRVHNAGEPEKAEASRRCAELNAAFQCLTEPKSRIRHLLELEFDAKPPDVQSIPPALANWFAEVAAAYRQVDAFLATKQKTTAPLLQVQLFAQGQEWIERLQSLQAKLNDWRANLLNELKSLDRQWVTTEAANRKTMLPQLEELYRLFGYLNRWTHQIQERLVQLSF